MTRTISNIEYRNIRNIGSAVLCAPHAYYADACAAPTDRTTSPARKAASARSPASRAARQSAPCARHVHLHTACVTAVAMRNVAGRTPKSHLNAAWTVGIVMATAKLTFLAIRPWSST